MSIARTWLGTPYHHQAAVKGAGCDCLGLVRGVYAELYGAEPETPPAYSRDLAEATQTETLLEAARRHLIELPRGTELTPGLVLIFRLRPGAMAKHCCILGGVPMDDYRWPLTMIHAFESGPVCEVALTGWWMRHIAAVFRFPEEPK